MNLINDPGNTITWLTIEPHTTSSRNLAEWFHRETGINIKITPVSYANITDVINQDIRSGKHEFDIVQYWYPMIGHLVQSGILMDITNWWAQHTEMIKPDDLIPVFRDNWCMVADRRFGIPFDGDMHLLFYNKTIFERNKLTPPVTWNEYLNAAKTITEMEKDNQIYGCGIMACDIPLILVGTFLNRAAGFGGNLFNEDNQPVVDSPENLAALSALIDQIPFALPDPSIVGFDEMLAPWIDGRVGMVEFWADLGKISDNSQGKISHNWGVVPLPKGHLPNGRVAAPLNAGWSLGISSQSRHIDLALDFLMYCLRPDVMLDICTSDGGPDPVRWSIYNLEVFKESVTEELAFAAKSAIQSAAVPWPTDPLWPQYQDVLHNNLYRAISLEISPQQALRDTQSVWMDIHEQA